MNLKRFLYSITLLLLVSACDDRDDLLFTPDPDLEVPDFIWKGLNEYYYWQTEVSDLLDNRFKNRESYTTFLSEYDDPKTFFTYLLSDEDRFSYITDDYFELQNSRAGKSRSNGVEFGLILMKNKTDVFGYVKYIVKNSDAANKDIARGDIFYAVNETPLTLNNYRDLLFGTNENYTLNMGILNADGTVTPNGISVQLSETELTVNPVFIVKTLTVNNIQTGYIMYNRFTSAFDLNLNEAFGLLKSNGISQLILDLRYNPGGSVNTATNLASMVTGQYKNELFTKLRYNEKHQSDNSDYIFRNKIEGVSIQSLELQKLYVITTKSTASASELIINGLDPYIDVLQVGDTTTGKNEASITLYDSPSFRFDDRGLNPNHTWAMQPLVARNENSVGFSDYTSGLIPELPQKEDLRNLGILGDPEEPLLSLVLNHIKGTATKMEMKKPIQDYPEIYGSELNTPQKNNMFIDFGDH